MQSNDPNSMASRDELATIFSFLHWKDIFRARVCKKWKEATEQTFVAPTSTNQRGWEVPEINVHTWYMYIALPWLVKALPNLQQLRLAGTGLGERFLFQEGEDPESRHGLSALHEPSANSPTPLKIDLSIISKFNNLQHLYLEKLDVLNGKYPFFFQFPRLQKLRIYGGSFLRWDLEMLSGLPMLQDLYVAHNHRLTGNIKSIRVLKKTLRKLTIASCWKVEGDLMELADFEHLEEVSLVNTKVTGDIREIKDDAFPKLIELDLPDGVYGGTRFDHIREAPELMRALYCLIKRKPTLFQTRRWGLNRESEEFYEANCHHTRDPPFHVEFKKVGKRQGWKWTNCVNGGDCEMNWLDPEPDKNSDDYADYVKELKEANRREVGFYRGFHEPPSEEEHRQLCRDIPLDPMLTRFFRNGHGRALWR